MVNLCGVRFNPSGPNTLAFDDAWCKRVSGTGCPEPPEPIADDEAIPVLADFWKTPNCVPRGPWDVTGGSPGTCVFEGDEDKGSDLLTGAKDNGLSFSDITDNDKVYDQRDYLSPQ